MRRWCGRRPSVESYEPAMISNSLATAPGPRRSSRIKDPERDGEDRVDVADDERAAWADSETSAASNDERERGARDAEHRAARRHVGVGHLLRLARARRRVERDSPRSPGSGRSRHVGRAAANLRLRDDGADRVAERGDEDRGGAEQLVGPARDVDPHQHDDAAEPDQEPSSRRPLARSAWSSGSRAGDEQRHGRDQDRRERRGHVLLAGGDQRDGIATSISAETVSHGE